MVYICASLLLLALESRDLSQAENKIKIQMVKVDEVENGSFNTIT